MARHPYAGEVKTRLGARLDAASRAKLYHAFLRDKFEQVCAVPDVLRAVAFTPREAESWFRSWAGSYIQVFAQCEGTLTDRVVHAFDRAFAAGSQHAILVDSDSPSLPVDYVKSAVRALENGRELVIGPADDGGFYLIGLSRPVPALFDGIEWSTARTRALALARAKDLGLAAELLPSWYDIDEPNDLARLVRELESQGHTRARHTREALAELLAAGVAVG